jgi:glycosyltransferase involved in cell wall biosynthesis
VGTVRILLVHNYYRSTAPSGENDVFEAEGAMLQRAGHEVRYLVRRSDDLASSGALGTVRGALSAPWNPIAAGAMRRAVQAFRPDVVHVHNVFPMLSPSVLHAVARPTALVITLHNYRVVCPAAIPLREGRPCTECLERRSAIPSLRYGCYRGSRLATLPLALSVELQRIRRTFSTKVDAVICLSDFQRDLLARAGLPEDRLVVKPNFLSETEAPVPWSGRRDAVVFVGRLSAEKGVSDLLEAWRLWGRDAPELRVVGDGEQRAELEATSQLLPGARVHFLGKLPRRAARDEIAHARLLVVPSTWYETFGMVVLQAMEAATPVAVAEIGSLPEIAGEEGGLTFPSGAPRVLRDRVQAAWQAPDRLEALGRGGRARFERTYTESRALERLMEIYSAAMKRSAGGATT